MSASVAHTPAPDAIIGERGQILSGLRPAKAHSESDAATGAARAKEIYTARRKRNELLPEVADLFHEPVWDMLLDLFIAGERGDYISIKSACIGSAVPPSTALRLLYVLEERAVVAIARNPFNKGRRYVKLSEATRDHMAEYLARM